MKRFLFLLALTVPLAARAAPVCEQPPLVCDGVTNDTAALQAALDVGGHVVLPAGSCLVTQVEIGGNTWLQGQGAGTTRLLRTSTATNLYGVIKNKNVDGSPLDTNIRITDLSIEWPNIIPDSGFFNAAIYIERASDVHIERVRGTQNATVGGESGYGSKGVLLRAANNGWLVDNEFIDVGDNAFSCSWGEGWTSYTGGCVARGNRYTQTTARNHSAMIFTAKDMIADGNYVTFPDPRHCCTTSQGTSCLYPTQACSNDASCAAFTPYTICVESTHNAVENGDSDPNQTFTNNTIINGGLAFAQCHRAIVASNAISGRGGSIAIQDAFGPCRDVLVTGNDVPNVTVRAYPLCCTSTAGTSCKSPRVDCSADSDCAGSVPYGTCAQQLDDITISNNRIHGASSATSGFGVQLATRYGRRIVVRGNDIYSNELAGLKQATSLDTLVEGNAIYSNGTGGCAEPRFCAGILLSQPRGGRFLNNTIHDNETSIWFENPLGPVDIVDHGQIYSNTFQPIRYDNAGGTIANPIRYLEAAAIGSPEGVHLGSPGSVWHRTDVGGGGNLYVKQSGTGNTGWILK